MQEEKVDVFYLLLQRTKGLEKSDLKVTKRKSDVECQKNAYLFRNGSQCRSA